MASSDMLSENFWETKKRDPTPPKSPTARMAPKMLGEEGRKGEEPRNEDLMPPRPEILLVLRICGAFGFTPFYLEGETPRLRFKWRSVQMLKFSLTWTLHFLYAVFAVRSLALDYAEGGARRGVMAAPWITGSGSVAFCMIAALWHKDSLIRVLNVPEECNDVLRAFDKEFQNTTKMMWKVHGFWFFIGLGATLSLSLMNWMEPTMRVFLSSVLCDSEQACPVPSLALSVLQQVHLTVYFYFANLFYDVLPVAYSAHCTTVMKGSTDLLVGHLFEVHSRKKASISLFETDNLQLSMPPDQNDKSTADVLRQTMDSHKHLQQLLRVFNPAFAPFILASLSLNFCMCITVFFNFVIAAGDDGEDWVSLLIYFGNGMQYMIRTSTVLTFFGLVRSEASRLRTVLLLDLDHRRGGCLGGDPDLATELQLFLASLEDVHVRAGPYLDLTHGVLFSFYGFLATYIAILYQSV